MAALQASLARYLPYGAAITGVSQMPHGLSNGTYLLEGVDRVLRMPPDEEGLLPPYELDRQYEIYRRVARSAGAPPVPVVSDNCDDESVVGAPFFVMEHLAGETFDRHSLPPWLTTDPAACDALCRAWVETVAKVHALPVATLEGLSPRRSIQEDARYWHAEALAHGAPTFAAEVLEALTSTPPAATGPEACVHGDPNLTNILWDGPRAVALLDWELSMIGEPFADIAFLLTFFLDEGEPADWGFDARGWWTKPQVVRHWEALTGRRVVSWRRHELLAMGRLATILAKGEGLVATGKKTDPRVLGFSSRLARYMDRFERRWARRDDDG